MSTIPPGWLGSILGTPAAQGRAAADQAKSRADQTRQTAADAFAERLQNVIDEGDRDGQVYSDAEGTGSQGRQPDSAGEPAAELPDDAPSAEGRQSASPDPPGLDLHA